MTMTDPIADMLTRLRNANQAYQESTSMPSSKIKVGIAEILKAEGYISNFELTEVEGQVGKVLKVTLKYGDSRERSIAGLRRISKPGLRVYAKAKRPPEGARRSRYRHHLHLPGAADRQTSKRQVRGRRSARLCLVTRRD